MSETLKKWSELLSNQAGFEVSRDGYTMDMTPRNVFQNDLPADDFEYEIQIVEEGTYFLTINDNTHACKCSPSPTGNAYYIDQQSPIRHIIAPGDVLRMDLNVIWQDRKKKLHSQFLFKGTFTVPEKIDMMGAPGYQVFIPHLKTNAYFTVGNIIGKDGVTNMELLCFHIVLLV